MLIVSLRIMRRSVRFNEEISTSGHLWKGLTVGDQQFESFRAKPIH